MEVAFALQLQGTSVPGSAKSWLVSHSEVRRLDIDQFGGGTLLAEGVGPCQRYSAGPTAQLPVCRLIVGNSEHLTFRAGYAASRISFILRVKGHGTCKGSGTADSITYECEGEYTLGK